MNTRLKKVVFLGFVIIIINFLHITLYIFPAETLN